MFKKHRVGRWSRPGFWNVLPAPLLKLGSKRLAYGLPIVGKRLCKMHEGDDDTRLGDVCCLGSGPRTEAESCSKKLVCDDRLAWGACRHNLPFVVPLEWWRYYQVYLGGASGCCLLCLWLRLQCCCCQEPAVGGTFHWEAARHSIAATFNHILRAAS